MPLFEGLCTLVTGSKNVCMIDVEGTPSGSMDEGGYMTSLLLSCDNVDPL